MRAAIGHVICDHHDQKSLDELYALTREGYFDLVEPAPTGTAHMEPPERYQYIEYCEGAPTHGYLHGCPVSS